jgi:hypothetical protein
MRQKSGAGWTIDKQDQLMHLPDNQQSTTCNKLNIDGSKVQIHNTR